MLLWRGLGTSFVLGILFVGAGCGAHRAGGGDGGSAADGGGPLLDGGLFDGGCGAPAAGVTPDPARPPVPDPALAGQVHRFFTITVLDADTKKPLPGAQLTTTNAIVLTSDDHGVVAFYEPGLMGLPVWFSVTHPGWTHAADGLGNRGEALMATEGGHAEVLMTRASGTAAPAQGDLQSRLAAGPVPDAAHCTAIRVVDGANQRGVPLVRLSAFGEDYWSDSQGMIAYCHPDHVGAVVPFTVYSHGYALADGTGSVALTTTRGGAATVTMVRHDLAERLYRVTGAGLYRDSVLLGLTTPLAAPLLAGQVMGQDTGSTTIYQGQLFWMWQDTSQVAYALGNFRGTAGVSTLPARGGRNPDLGSDITYFVGDNGFAAPMSEPFDPGSDPVWIDALVAVPDAAGVERLFAGYAKVAGTGASVDAGVMRFDDQAHLFRRVVSGLQNGPAGRPTGHVFKWRHGADAWVYDGLGLRVPGHAEAFATPAAWQQFGPYGENGDAALRHHTDGTLDYQWRAGARPASAAQLAKDGVSADQSLDGHLTDADGGGAVQPSATSVDWNRWRRRFVAIDQQAFGASSFAGELWYAEADTPMGPWVYARKVVTHDDYTFYNPLWNPEFSRDGGRVVYFEGTYTRSYSNAAPTPRYDYNQQLYRLDLGDERLALPVALYERGGPGALVTRRGLERGDAAVTAAFFALDRPGSGAQPYGWSGPACGSRRLTAGAAAPLFWAPAPATGPLPANLVALYEWSDGKGGFAYRVDGAAAPAGFTRAAAPLAWVWRNPVQVALPVADYLGDLVAVAGADQCLAAGADGTAAVQLDGGGSSSLAGAITGYRWEVDGGAACQALTGAQVSLRLLRGLHTVRLVVTDATGDVAEDQLLISVR